VELSRGCEIWEGRKRVDRAIRVQKQMGRRLKQALEL
jgi:hypothetical protein